MATKANTLTTKQKRDRWQLGLCFALVAASMLVVFYYVVFPSRTVFQADCSDTLYWAKAAWDAGAIFNKDFYYPTLQPFGGWFLMLPFVGLFGFSLTSHILGMVLFVLLFMGGLWFFCSALNTGLKHKLLLFSAVLLLMSGSAKLRELLWEHVIYYSLGILFTMLFLGLAFRIMRDVKPGDGANKSKKLVFWCVCWLVLSLLVGTDGMQVLLFCSIPVAGALVAERFFDVKAKGLTRANVVSGGLVLTLAVGSGVGLLLLKLLSSGTRPSEYTDLHTVFSPVDQWGENIAKLPAYWASLVGFAADPGESIVSPAGLVELLRLFFAILLVVVPLVAAFRYGKCKDRQFRIVLWVHGFVSAITLLSHIVGTTANAYWRFTPAVFTALVVTVWTLVMVWEEGTWKRVAGVLGAALFLLCAVNVQTMVSIPWQNGQNQPYVELAATLEHHGLTYGFGDYFVSQTVTVLSGDRVKVRNSYMDDEGIHMRGYQSARRWYDDIPGIQRYFVVMSRQEYDGYVQQSEIWQQIQENVQQEVTSGDYLILVFDENPIGLTRTLAEADGAMEAEG